MNRKELLQTELNAFTERVKEHCQPEKIIVFGSFASGVVTDISDLDVVIVAESNEDFWSRLAGVSKYCSRRVGMDILFYTPQEYQQLLASRTFFKQEIAAKGKVIYDRSQPS